LNFEFAIKIKHPAFKLSLPMEQSINIMETVCKYGVNGNYVGMDGKWTKVI
jgi:hypothetical protein